MCWWSLSQMEETAGSKFWIDAICYPDVPIKNRFDLCRKWNFPLDLILTFPILSVWLIQPIVSDEFSSLFFSGSPALKVMPNDDLYAHPLFKFEPFFFGRGVGGLIFHQTFHWSSIFSNLNPSHLKACWALDLGAQVLSCWLCIAFGYGWAENKRRDKVLLLLLYLWCEGKRFGLLR